jgi:hypothetical protein
MEEAINVLDDLQPRSMSKDYQLKLKKDKFQIINRHCLVRYNI